MRLILAASALILIALPGAASQRTDRVPAATPNGKPVDCLRLTDIRATQVRDGATIDFVTRNGRVYRNHLDGGQCPSLASERRFLYKTSIGQLCSVDTITVLQTQGLGRGASCGLGQFEPVTLAR